MKIAAVVVFFNPDENVVENICSYIDVVDKVFVLDNSKKSNVHFLEKIDSERYTKLVYIPQFQNIGLAKALNIACKRAVDEGFDAILTMDQDSCFEDFAAKKLVDFYNNNLEYAIVSPNIRAVVKDEKNQVKLLTPRIDVSRNVEKKWVITSGSIMSLDKYRLVGGFDENLFVDEIDIDIGIKFSKMGFPIVMVGQSVLHQEFGNAVEKRLFGKTLYPNCASPIRTYYLFRNRIYLRKKYPEYKKDVLSLKTLFNYAFKIIVFEDCKMQKLKYAYQGVLDAFSLKMGVAEESR